MGSTEESGKLSAPATGARAARVGGSFTTPVPAAATEGRTGQSLLGVPVRRSQRWSQNGWGSHVSRSSGLGSYMEIMGRGVITSSGDMHFLSSQFPGPSFISPHLNSPKDRL